MQSKPLLVLTYYFNIFDPNSIKINMKVVNTPYCLIITGVKF